MSQLIYGLNRKVRSTGSLGIGSIKDEGKIRYIISEAGPANVVRIRARINNQQTWVDLIDLTGNANELITVDGYDQVEVICLVFNPSDGYAFNIVASSFNSTSFFIDTPDGTIDGATVLNLYSSDNSIDISANPTTGDINFRATGGGGPSSPHVFEFVVGDWVLNVDVYEISILADDHIKGINPSAQVFENILSDFEEVEIGIELNIDGDITLTVPQNPDLRFDGKIIIS